jgi:hypothetical protein
MKNITRTISFMTLGVMSLMLALGVIAMNPSQARADYYDRGYYGTPSYNYDNNYYHQPPRNDQGPLQATCYPMPISARTGDSVNWVASAYGGNGSYNFTWSGDDSLSGYGSSISKIYYRSGSKSASVTVTSGGQSVTKICDGTARISGDVSYDYNIYPNYNYNTYPNYYNTYPNYNYNTYGPALYVTCSASTLYANSGNSVTWSAYPSGGSGVYSYSWSGTDGLYGVSQSMYYTYPIPGLKTASVTIYSNGQTMTANCGNVNVGGYYGGVIPVVTGSNNSGLDVACYADPSTVRVNQPVTWRAEVTGGVGSYTYTWTGSDGLGGTDSTAIKYYTSTGDKSAIVSVKSADGKTATRACSTSVTVRSATAAAPTQPVQQPVQQVQPNTNQNSNGLSAAALFSLKNVPWGWVAILIILVLFATVVYLIFNRPKI